MSVYARPIATAKRLIDKYGAFCTWEIPALLDHTVPGYPTEVPDSAKSFENIKIAFFTARDLGRGVAESLGFKPGTEVPEGAVIGLMAASGLPFIPSLNHTLTRKDGTPNTIANIDVLKPADEPILYFVRLNE